MISSEGGFSLDSEYTRKIQAHCNSFTSMQCTLNVAVIACICTQAFHKRSHDIMCWSHAYQVVLWLSEGAWKMYSMSLGRARRNRCLRRFCNSLCS